MIGQEIEDEILIPNSVHSRPGKENSEKNSKKIEKLKKNHFPALFLVSNSIHIPPGKENCEKNSKKIQKNKIPLSSIIFSQNEMR